MSAGPLVAQARPGLELNEDTEIIARRGDVTVTAADLDHYLSGLEPEDRPVFLSSPERLEQMLESLLLDRVLAADLIDQGHLDDPVNVAAARQAVFALLSKTNRDRVRQVPDGVDLEQLAREQYLANPDRHIEEGTASFTQLLLRADDANAEEVGERATALHQRISQGEDFDDLVLAHSEEPRVEEHGGRFENVPLSQLVERFSRQVSRLESSGEISAPFRTEFGWHIVRLDGRTEARRMTFDEVRERLVGQARANVLRREYTRYVNRLLDDAPASLDQEALDRYMQQQGD
ncbi:MAG: peptidylprolyl isomerase [Wenzhouxiangellaceae bacterium]